MSNIMSNILLWKPLSSPFSSPIGTKKRLPCFGNRLIFRAVDED